MYDEKSREALAGEKRPLVIREYIPEFHTETTVDCDGRVPLSTRVLTHRGRFHFCE